MVLSPNGDHLMTKLSDTQLVILSAAAQRDDLSVLPLPESLNLKGCALNKVMDSLRKRGLIRVLGGDGGPERVVITSEGMAAIGVETDDDEALAAADAGEARAGQAHAGRRHQAGPDDRDAQAARGRHGGADRRRHLLAASHDPRRHLRRPQKEARP